MLKKIILLIKYNVYSKSDCNCLQLLLLILSKAIKIIQPFKLPDVVSTEGKV